MDTAADDLHEPDEARPAKRPRLDAPLDVTEEVEEEMIDDEDLYGTDMDGEVSARAVIDEPHLKPTVGEDNSHELPNSITIANSGEQAHINGFATPGVGSEGAVDTEDLYGDGTAETADGLPAAAVDHGNNDFVAPPQHVEGQDGVEMAVQEETLQVEAEKPVGVHALFDGEQQAPPRAAEPSTQTAPPNGAVEAVSIIDGAHHIAPPRVRQEADVQVAEGRSEKVEHENDVLGDLESALKAGSVEDAKGTGKEQITTTKPKDDPAFLEAAAAQKGSESAEWQFDSSDAESSTSDNSDSSDSDSDSESGSEGGYEMLDPATAAKILMSGDGEDDEGKEKGKGGSGPRTTNEVKDEIVPKPDVEVTEDMKITLLGTVQRAVENLVLVEGATPGEYQVLESGSVLCNSSREVIGAVYETLGQVQKPMYSVAFTNAQEIDNMGLVYGTQVFYVDAHSTFVFTQPLKKMKGTDASNIHDEEVGEDEIEFSDDEKEAEYKRQKKAAKRGGRGGLTRTDFNSDRGGMRTFGAPGHDSGHTFVGGSVASDAPQTSYGGGMSYDDGDAEDDFYQPLKRPDNLSEMMAGGPPPPPPQRGFDRGRGRGRGRGDRGKGDRGRARGGFNQQRGHHQSTSPELGHRGGHGPSGQRSDFDQANGHRGNAHSFPDRHNKHGKNKGRGQHNLPPKPHGQHSPTPPKSSPPQQYQQYAPYPAQQHQQPAQVHQPQQTYQFNGYTFQYGNPPPPPPAQHQHSPQQQQQQYYQQSYQQQSPTQQQSPGGQQFPAGVYVNPAFWTAQQQQHQSPPQQYGAWGAQAQQPQQQYAQSSAPGQQGNLADILRVLGGQSQGQR